MSMLKASAGFTQFNSSKKLEWSPQVLGKDIVLGVWTPYADGNTVTESSGAITQVDDLSGNNYHMVVTSNGNSPNWNSGTNEVEFDATNTEGLWADMLTGDNTSYDINLFVVYEPISSSNNDKWFTAQHGSRTNVNDAGLVWANGLSGMRVWKSNSVEMSHDPGNNLILLHIQVNQTSGGFIRENGTEVDSTINLFGGKLNQLCIASDNSTTDFVTMNFRGAVIVKDGLTTDNYERIEGWLAEKCGIMADLDASHSYKNYTFTEPTNDWNEIAFSSAVQYTAGLTSLGGDNYNWTGGGEDIFGTSDDAVFYYKLLGDDITIDVYIEDISLITGDQVGIEQYAGAYLMVRESLDNDSVHYSIGTNPNNNRVQQKRRETTGASTQETNFTQNPSSPLYLRTVRASGVLTQYWSTDDITYNQIGTTPTIGTGDWYIGVAIVSHDDSAPDLISAVGTITIT